MTDINQLEKDIKDLNNEIVKINKEIDELNTLKSEKLYYGDLNAKLDREITNLRRQIDLLNAENKNQSYYQQKLEIENKEYESMKNTFEKFEQKYKEWIGCNDENKEKFIKDIENKINEHKKMKEGLVKKIEKIKNQ